METVDYTTKSKTKEEIVPEERLPKNESIKEAIKESKGDKSAPRIDNSFVEEKEDESDSRSTRATSDNKKEITSKKPQFKFDDDEDDDEEWEALPPFLRRKK